MSIELAAHIAERSSIRRHKTGAVIVDRKGELISVGWSHFSAHRMKEYYSMHAELHAIIRAGSSIKDAAAIYIACYAGKSGNLCVGRPCRLCMAAILDVEIPRIYFTNRERVGVITNA